MSTQKLTPEIISAAILGFEEQKRLIDSQIGDLRALLTGQSAETAPTVEPATRKRRKMSAAGRARIAEAQRKRWAASRKAAEPSTPEAAPKPKRRLSAAGRRAISLATKRRWALRRAEAAKTQSAAKKTAVKKAAVKGSTKSAKKPATKKTVPAPQTATEAAAQ
jgi:hypothetical protein